MTSETIIDRRAFLISAGLLGVAVSAADGAGPLVESANAATSTEIETFRALSSFLTGARDLDLNLAARALAQLTALDPDFARKSARLAEAVKAVKAPNIDAFLASAAAGDAALRETMVTIVSAWYLGFTGTPIPLRANDNTGFLTFTRARMYEPTIDATVRPSYARAAPGYWIDPPPFVKAPAGPPGLRSWGSASPKGIGTIPGAASASESAPAISDQSGTDR